MTAATKSKAKKTVSASTAKTSLQQQRKGNKTSDRQNMIKQKKTHKTSVKCKLRNAMKKEQRKSHQRFTISKAAFQRLTRKACNEFNVDIRLGSLFLEGLQYVVEDLAYQRVLTATQRLQRQVPMRQTIRSADMHMTIREWCLSSPGLQDFYTEYLNQRALMGLAPTWKRTATEEAQVHAEAEWRALQAAAAEMAAQRAAPATDTAPKPKPKPKAKPLSRTSSIAREEKKAPAQDAAETGEEEGTMDELIHAAEVVDTASATEMETDANGTAGAADGAVESESTEAEVPATAPSQPPLESATPLIDQDFDSEAPTHSAEDEESV